MSFRGHEIDPTQSLLPGMILVKASMYYFPTITFCDGGHTSPEPSRKESRFHLQKCLILKSGWWSLGPWPDPEMKHVRKEGSIGSGPGNAGPNPATC